MRVSSPLGPGDCRAGPHGQADAAGLREALREAGQDGCGGRGGDLRSSNPADDAFRRDQDTGAASDADAAQDTRSAGTPAHHADQCAQGSSNGVRHRQRPGNGGLGFARQNNANRAWAARLIERKRPKVVAVALANKTARIAWALLARGTTYAPPTA